LAALYVIANPDVHRGAEPDVIGTQEGHSSR
jgi:hypothetical protein